MNISLDDLRQAHSGELYRLYLTIGRMLEDPVARIASTSASASGMNLAYVADDPFGPLSQRRVIELCTTQPVVEDHARGRRWAVLYAAIVPDVPSAQPQPEPAPPPRARREEFFVGGTVGFTDKHLRERIGAIVRLNQKTASIASSDTEGHWRVSCSLLRRIVDIELAPIALRL